MARQPFTATAVPALEPLLSAQEAMAYLGVSRAFCTRHAAELGGIKIGPLLKFRRSSLDAYIERQRIQAEPPATPEPAPVQIERVRRYGRGPTNPITGKKWGS